MKHLAQFFSLRRPHSLRRRLMFAQAMLGALILLILGGTLVMFVHNTEAAAWRSRQAEVGGAAAGKVTDFIHRIQGALELSAQLDREYLEAHPQAINDFLEHETALLEVIRLDAQGQVFAAGSDVQPVLANLFTIPQSNWFLQARAGRPYLGEVQISSTDEPFLILSQPAPDGGVVAARLRLNLLWEVVEAVEFGRTGLAYVIDQDGDILAHPDRAVVLSFRRLPAENPLLSTDAPVPEFSQYFNLAGERVEGSIRAVAGTPWRVVTELPMKESQAAALASLWLAAAFLVVIAAHSFAISWILQTMVFSPVEKLRQGAERIGRGELSSRIGLAHRNEIGQVGAAFDEMAACLVKHESMVSQKEDALRRLNDELEERVEQRTAALEDMNAELEQVNEDLTWEVAERERAEKALQHKTYQQERLIATARGLTESLDTADLLTRVGQGALDILESYSCIIALLEADGETLRPVIALDPRCAEEILAAEIKVHASLTGQAVLARRGLIFNDPYHHESVCLIPNTPEDEAERLITAPFLVDDLAVGAMTLSRVEQDYTGEDLALAETFAAYAASALKNAQAHTALQREVEERRRAEQSLRESQQQIMHQALHDKLTALPNRALFMERSERALALTQRHPDHQAAVLFLDLDRFKLVNDSLGHAAGDELLAAVARRLEGCLRPGDTVARFGGDEFAILLEDILQVGDATRVAQRIQRSLSQPFVLDGHEVFSSASIGIALTASGYTGADDLIRDADAAMYRAKANGKSRHEIFDAEMFARNVALLQLEADLRRAVAAAARSERAARRTVAQPSAAAQEAPPDSEFHLFYQPVVSLKTGRIAGVEALLRWQHPQRGLLLPGEFISLVEENGLIVPLGEWVLCQACQQAEAWRAAGFLGLGMAVNISARQVRDGNLTALVRRALAETGLEPGCLELEITERDAMVNSSLTIQTLGELRALGVALSIDDFGSGYSSFGYLKRFPLNTLKIDRSFMRDLAETGSRGEEVQDGIVPAIIAMAHVLGLKTIAEGVETAAQARFLQRQGCDLAQGFLIARALPAEQITAMLEAEAQGTICLRM